MVRRNEKVPADVLLIYATNNVAFMDVSDINGKAQVVTKFPFVKNVQPVHIQNFRGKIKCPKADNLIEHWYGVATINGFDNFDVSISNLLLKGSTLRHNDWVAGIAIYTGSETKFKPKQCRVKQSVFAKEL